MRGPLGVTSVLLALFAFAVSADTWVPPSVRHYPSATGDHVFIVEPNLMPGADGVVPKGRLVTASGALVWERTLPNEVAPASALVSSDARFVVTFDNWGAVGHGPHVVVIYDADGRHAVAVSCLHRLTLVGRRAQFRVAAGARAQGVRGVFRYPQ